ncbi:MAG: signal peptidase II [Phycisphaerae bacterium]
MTESPAETSNRALYSSSAQAFFWITAIIAAGLDLASKEWAFHVLKLSEKMEVIHNLLYFEITMNPGAVFGIGAGKRWLFIGASLLAIIFILQLFFQSRARQRGFQFLLALVMGGAIGNLYDRVLFGMVRDFIHFSITIGGRELWPWVFNVADAALVAGVAGLLFGWLLGRFEIGGSCPVARPLMEENER